MSQRLTRKEIKHDIREDSFRQSVAASLEYVMGHTRMLLMIAGGIVVAIALGFGIRYYLSERQESANLLLARAVTVYEAPVVETGAQPEDPDSPSFLDAAVRAARARELFQQTIDEHGGSGAAAAAAVYLGRLELDAGHEPQARELWEQFLEDHPGHMLAASVRVSLLGLDRQAGQAEEVAAQLRAGLESSKPPLPADLAWYQLGLTLEELGRDEEARDAYRRVSDEHPESPYAQLALSKVQQLDDGGRVG